MGMTVQDVCADAGRPAGELTRRDVARALLSVPAAQALDDLPVVRRQLTAAGNPLSGPFWEHVEGLLASIAEGTATVGDVRRGLEATGTEPTMIVAGGFLWPEEDERGPVAREMHARLVAHLEELVAAGAIDPDRLLAGDRETLAAYEQAQVAWLETPLPDGREPMWAVSDEEDEAFLAAWDEAEADARTILEELLAPVGPRPCPEPELAAVCSPLREELAGGGWPYDVLAAAGGVDPADLPADDRDLWLTLASGVVECRGDPPGYDADDGEVYSAWFALDHASWIGAVVAVVRAGPGAPADADTLAHLAATFDFEADDEEADDDGWPAEWTNDDDWMEGLEALAGGFDDEAVLAMGFHTVELLWRALGAVDEEARLTELGWWGAPEALLRAWSPPV